MAHINIDNRILDNISNENLVAVLNKMIESELSKSIEHIDTVFVDECVDALLELEQNDNDRPLIIPLISSEKFLKKITGNKISKSFKSMNIFARVAVVAAIIAGSTATANATVEAVTGVNVLEKVANSVEEKLIEWGFIEDIDVGFDDGEPITVPETTTKPVATTTEPTTEPATEPTTRPETTTEFRGIEDIDVIDDDDTTQHRDPIEDLDVWDDDEDITETTNPKPAKPSTTQQTTAKPVIEQTTEDGEEAVFTGLRAEYNNFRFDYIYGEELSYDGLALIASYSDGTEKEIALDDCKYTRAIDTTVTADYTLSIIYKSSSLSINVTVRPDEFTRGSEICSNECYEYLLTDEGAYVTEYKGYSDNIDIDEIDGNKVVAIGPSCFKGIAIKSFKAQDVTRIYPNAFENCKMLTECYTPSAEYIGDYAFNSCELLDNAVYSDKLEYIGKYAYSKTAIEEIEIPEGVTEIKDFTFNECTALKTVTMLGNVTEIGSNSFNGCTALESVTGCQNIVKVGDFAFANDEIVKFDTFPQGLEEVGTSSFYFCRELEIGALPSTIRVLAPSAFAYCQGMTEIVIPEGISIIPDNCFRATNATKIVLPEGVTEIQEYAFMSCKAKSIELPASLKSIKTYGLYSVLLHTVYFDKYIEDIGVNAFYAGKSVSFYVYDDTVPMYYAQANEIKYQLLKEGE